MTGDTAPGRYATTTPDDHQLAQMTRGVVLALGIAVGDLEQGRYDGAERERLAGYLDRLAAALRSDSQPRGGLVVDAEHTSTSLIIDQRRAGGEGHP